MKQIGLIGAGLLGSAIAERLLASGYGVIAFDVSHERMQAVRALGGQTAVGAAEVAERCGCCILSLPHSGITAQVLAELAPVLTESHSILDTTTGEPAGMEAFGRQLASRGIAYLDATVAGSSEQVRTREAIAMVGGELPEFERCRELLDAFTCDAFHLGPWGAGARMKLVVNLVLGLNRAVLAEGLAFAEACGVDPRRALEVLTASPASSRAMDVKGEKMLAGDWRPQARLRQHRKDVRLVLAEGERAGARLPLTELHQRLLAEAEEAGWADADNSSILEVFRRRDAGTRQP